MQLFRSSTLSACRRSSLPSTFCKLQLSGVSVLGRAHLNSYVTPTGSTSRKLFPARAMTATAAAPATQEVKAAPQPIFRKDYRPPPYFIKTAHLTFVLNEDFTIVHSKLHLAASYNSSSPPPLFLNGRKDVKLVSVKVNGNVLKPDQYVLQEKSLTITELPSGNLDLEITTEIKPQENTLLEGLYKSGGNFCTQCEPEGFRGITFFQDHPDVMAKYTTRIEADKKYPVLLSNGNLIESGDLPEGRHFAVWEDPFPKPCYLFALVAGDLAMKERTFITKSGRKVALRIFVQPADLGKVDWGLESLIRSMKWDEERYGLEYDLDLFNIVAVDDFNMGAMENKSLNIFNSSLVLASEKTATDGDFKAIESVVAHEYFHNWTGNRVTCRDWFQITLKEGLTVFRDHEFTADHHSRPVKRIEDVLKLRNFQFPQDAGPLAHPVRPESYIKMENFYTVTVYEKGSEVVRMYQTLLGKEGFRKGMDLYFQRHDGCAVTCDDFLAAMADANGADLSSLAVWYQQSGTPTVEVTPSYDAASRTYTLRCKQSIAPTAKQPNPQPCLIPLEVGLLGPDGHDLPLHLAGSDKELGTTTVLALTQAEQTFTFTGVEHPPVPSILRGYSAPVKLTVVGQSDADLLFMLAHDSDPFNRWEAGQRLGKSLLLSLYDAVKAGSPGASLEDTCAAAGGVPDTLVEAFRAVLLDTQLDGSFQAMAITLPSETEMIDAIPQADPVACCNVRDYVTKTLARRLQPELVKILRDTTDPPGTAYLPNAQQSARRALKNKALALLATLEDPEFNQELLRRFREATNMTDQISALAALVELNIPERQLALDEFYSQWKDDALVVLKWLGLQAASNAPGNLAAVQALTQSPAFSLTTPNCCYRVFLGFARSAINFHNIDGSGYKWLADWVLQLDGVNKQVASRVTSAFTTWRNYDPERQAMMKAQLQRVVAHPGLSENVFEIAHKSLEAQ